VKRAAVIALAVLAVFLLMHRALVHEIVVDAVLAGAPLAGLCLVIAVGGRQKARPVRYRAPSVQPAVAARPRLAGPGDPCSEACGRPATRMFDRWPVCDDCGGRLDAAAEHARRPAGFTGELFGEPAGYDPPALTQPPAIPAGETIGTVDMTEFEERAS
jgi:hypothetical protein